MPGRQWPPPALWGCAAPAEARILLARALVQRLQLSLWPGRPPFPAPLPRRVLASLVHVGGVHSLRPAAAAHSERRRHTALFPVAPSPGPSAWTLPRRPVGPQPCLGCPPRTVIACSNSTVQQLTAPAFAVGVGGSLAFLSCCSLISRGRRTELAWVPHLSWQRVGTGLWVALATVLTATLWAPSLVP